MNVTPALFKLAKDYLAIVDSGDEARQGDERTAAHESLMDEMQKCKIPFRARWEARYIARWILSQNLKPITELPELKVMFAEVNDLNGIVIALHDEPPDDNKAGFMPVLVTILPFELASPIYERNT